MKSYALEIISVLALSLPVSLPAEDVFPPERHNPIIAKSWFFIGPFPADGAAGSAALEKEFPPDKECDFCSRYPGEDGKMLSWSGFPDPNARKMTFDIKGRAEKPAVFFAVCYAESPSDGKVSFSFRSDVPGKLRINGGPLGELRPGASATYSIDLKKGMNELLVKCLLEKAGDGFSAAADDAVRGLVFTGHVPWPMTPVPASAWRFASVAPADADAARTALLKKDEIGLAVQTGAGAALAWSEAKSADDGSLLLERRSPDETLFLVCHILFPLKFHVQEYKFKLLCPKGTSFCINGRKMEGAYDEGSKIFSCRSFAHAMRAGLNRTVMEVPPGEDDARIKLEMSNPGDVKLMAEVPPALDPKVHVGDWPSAVISNGIITAKFAIPDVEKGYYRGNRFEQAGIITHLERNGHSYFLDAPAVHSPLDSNECCGPCEEWFEAIAYDDARPGEAFIKLGVGLYEKPFNPTHLWYCAYWPLKIFPWTTKAEKDRVEFVQEVDGPRGWGYRYVKRLVLVPDKPVLLIEHALTNTGKHRIDAEQYAHNFLALGRRLVEKGLAVEFSFPPKTAADISKIGVIEGNRLKVTADKVEVKFVPVEGWEHGANDVTAKITSPGTPAGIRIGGDFAVSKMGVFFSPDQVSCEPFVKVSIEPGGTAAWTRSYEFFVDGK